MMKTHQGVIAGFISLLVGVVATPQAAHATILNYGANVDSEGFVSDLGNFYSGDDDGIELIPLGQGLPHSFVFMLDPASTFSGYTVNAATLFIDAENVEINDSSQVLVQGILMTDPLFSNVPGGVGGCSSAEAVNSISRIPCISGGTAKSPLGDDDNSFYALSLAQIATLSTEHTWTVEIRNTSPRTTDTERRFRIDGINIQADVRLLSGGDVIVPEPASMFLFGLGGLIASGTTRKRRKNSTMS